MLYYLFEYLELTYQLPGAGVFQYISFRAAMAVITSLIVSLIFGGKIIRLIKNKQIGERVRTLGLEGEQDKKGTPTMGGLIILAAILLPTLLFAKLDNIYIVLMILSTLWLGTIGFIDDYIKVFKKDKKGLAGKFKIVGQVVLGLIIGLTLYFHDSITIKEKIRDHSSAQSEVIFSDEVKSLKTTIPFLKNNELDYNHFVEWIDEDAKNYSWILFVFLIRIYLN